MRDEDESTMEDTAVKIVVEALGVAVYYGDEALAQAARNFLTGLDK